MIYKQKSSYEVIYFATSSQVLSSGVNKLLNNLKAND